jgi:beta-glucosidase
MASPARAQLLERVREAARHASGSDQFVSFHLGDGEVMLPNLIAAHKAGFQAIKAVRAELPVGVTLAVVDYQAAGPDSRVEEVRDYVYGAWLKAITETGDFVGVQNYGRSLIDATGEIRPPKEVERNSLSLEYYPAGLGNAVRYVHAATSKPILVSENGISTNDDMQRIRYIDGALAGLRAAMADGIPVLGYIHWSLLDNFEWSIGYGPKFGLVAVDRKTFVRTPKASAWHLGKIAGNFEA